jgi:hypothetical protein
MQDQRSNDALLLSLLQVSRSPEAHRNLAQVVAEEEAQLDAMASEMSPNQGDSEATLSAKFDRTDTQQAEMSKGFWTAPGVYETKLDTVSTVSSASDSTLVDTMQSFAPISFASSSVVVTAAPPAVVTKSSGVAAAQGTCNPSCESGHGLCHNGICLCRSPYIGETCRDIDLRATRHLAAIRSVKMLTTDPGTAFLLLSEVPIMLAILVITLCVIAAVLFATFIAHVYFNINAKSDNDFEAEEQLAQEDFHEAWLRDKKKHKHLMFS